MTTAKYPRVLVVGPSSGQGGIASVIHSHRGMPFWKQTNCCSLSTYKTGTVLTRMLTMLAAYLRAVFQIPRASLVHIHVAAQHSMWRKLPIIVIAKLMRKPYVLHLHAASERSLFVLTPQWLVRLSFLLSYRVIVLSDYWSTLVKAHLPDARVIVIHNPVRRADIPVAPDRTPMILYVGKIEPRKGYIELLRAAAQVLAFFPDVTFCFAGHGDIAGAKTEAARLNIGRSVLFPGWLAFEQLAGYYRRASIFCLPSFDEGLPMAVIEAMSYSLPVVTTPVGGLPDLISDGVNGLFTAPGDVEGIAHQLLALLRNPERAERLGRNGALTVEEKCDPLLISQQLLSLYQEVDAEWTIRRHGLRENASIAMHP